MCARGRYCFFIWETHTLTIRTASGTPETHATGDKTKATMLTLFQPLVCTLGFGTVFDKTAHNGPRVDATATHKRSRSLSARFESSLAECAVPQRVPPDLYQLPRLSSKPVREMDDETLERQRTIVVAYVQAIAPSRTRLARINRESRPGTHASALLRQRSRDRVERMHENLLHRLYCLCATLDTRSPAKSLPSEMR